MKRKLASAIVIAGMMVSVAACGGNDGKDSKDAGPSSWKGQTLTVWTMDGSAPPQWSKDVQAAFEKKTGAKLKFEIQKWDGIQQKITTALSEDTPPDVLEVGNTQTAGYAASGGLMDITSLKSSLGGDDWAASTAVSTTAWTSASSSGVEPGFGSSISNSIFSFTSPIGTGAVEVCL